MQPLSVSFRVRSSCGVCQPQPGRNAGEKMTCRSNYEEAWRAVEAVRQENRPGSMAASRPVRHGDSMAHRNTRPRSAAGRIKRHSQLVTDATDRSRVQRWCQQSSSEQASYRSLPHSCESSLAALLLLSKSNPLRWASIWFWNWRQGSSPYCIRTDLVQNQKETGFRKLGASYFEVLLLQGVPAL